MLPVERQNRILKLARREGTVRTIDLARDFEVAEETIRRDLDFLSKRGHLKRTHGGAMDVSAPLAELPYLERETQQLEEKVAIAKDAASLLAAGETILLDTSSTALQLASHIPLGMPLRVVTHSVAVIERLMHQDDVELIQLGGIYEARGRRYSGSMTEMGVRSLKIDRFFYSGGGLDPVRGISEPNPEQARLKRVMLEHAIWNCLLIDHTKLGHQTDHFFARPEEVHSVITDTGGAAYAKEHLAKVPFEVRVAR